MGDVYQKGTFSGGSSQGVGVGVGIKVMDWTYLSLYVHIYLYTYVPMYLSIYLSTYLSTYIHTSGENVVGGDGVAAPIFGLPQHCCLVFLDRYVSVAAAPEVALG